MDKGLLRILDSKSLIEDSRHAVEVDEAHPFPRGHPLHCFRIVQMGLDDFAFGVEITPVGRRYQHRDSAFGAHSVYEGFQLGREVVISSSAGP